MSVDTATPADSAGSVGDRYHLVECVAGDPDGPAVAWRAWDTLLARPVTLTVVQPGGIPAAGFLSHAHAVSTVVHPALARVWDAVDDGTRAYVVSEWVTGTPLTVLLRDGALEPETASATICRVAEGIAAAHAAGVAFGGVHPDHVVVTPAGGVTLAQVVGDGRATAADDVRGLGALLYAALTGAWPLAPTGGAAALRPAAGNGDHLMAPRQVRAGVAEDVSTLAMRALAPDSPQGVSSAAAFAAVLAERAAPPQDELFAFETDTDRPRRLRPRWLTIAVPVAAGFCALALLGWLVGSALGRVPKASGGTTTPLANGSSAPSSAPPTTPAVIPLQAAPIANATLYDPQGDNGEDLTRIKSTFDGSGTGWSTVTYQRNAQFGSLKKGLGLAYDLGSAVTAREATVSASPGINLQILAGNAIPDHAVAPSQYQVVGQLTGAGTGPQQIPLQPTAARYYIVWITQLIPRDAGFGATLFKVGFQR